MITAELTQDRQVYELLAENAKTHLERNPFLRVGEFNPNNPYHRLKNTFAEAAPAESMDIALSIAEGFYPGFYEEMVNPLIQRVPRELMEIATILDKGEENVGIITAHEDLRDVIMGSFAVTAAMSELGLADFKDLVTKNHLFVSRTIGTFEVGDADDSPHLVDVLRKAGNIHMTLPWSQRIIDAGIPESIIKSNGRKVSSKLGLRTRGGRTFCIAAPGESDHVEYDEQGNIMLHKIKPVPESNARLISKIGNVMSLAIVMSKDRKCFVPSPLIKINSIQGVDQELNNIAIRRTRATGIPTSYSQPVRK